MSPTPGPWTWDKYLGRLTNGDGKEVLSATVRYWGDDDIDGSVVVEDDDARLIAAAPELLSCARAVRHMLPLGLQNRDVEALAAKLDAAIAKAEGRL